ncbi:MAG: hypothetical protein WCV80_01155 [Candidatus Paceibacterota bacterium]|jgi:hypothetical protein
MEIEIKNLFTFYDVLGRPLTLIEIFIHLPSLKQNIQETRRILSKLIREKIVIEEDGFYRLRGASYDSMSRRKQDLLGDMKWKKLVKLSRWFRYVPFVQFVVASGSLAFGNVNARSDFDVVVGVSSGRMFTARYFLLALFSLLHGRRMDDAHESSPDKLCFNHFVTPDTYEKLPHNTYRLQLYRNTIPLWGDENALQDFITQNVWADLPQNSVYDTHRNKLAPSNVKIILEKLLKGSLGEFVEQKIMRPIAMKRLEKYIANKENNGRVVVSDKELEFHFNLNYEKRFSDTATSLSCEDCG